MIDDIINRDKNSIFTHMTHEMCMDLVSTVGLASVVVVSVLPILIQSSFEFTPSFG